MHIFQMSTHFIMYFFKGAHLLSGLIRNTFRYWEAMKFMVVDTSSKILFLAFLGAQFFILGNKYCSFYLKGQTPFVHF